MTTPTPTPTPTPTRETMTYKQGKIYKIEPIVEHEEGEIYIGSTTCKYLSQRMKNHRADYDRWKEGKRGLVTSFNLFGKYGLEKCQILLIENVCCEYINELKTREAYYIRTLKCVNKIIPLRTINEYYQDNKDKILEQQRERYDENKDTILEKQREKYRNYREELIRLRAIIDKMKNEKQD